MLDWIWAGIMVTAIVFGTLCGKLDAVANAAVSGAQSAVTTMIAMTGMMCFWCGIMEAAQRAGAMNAIKRVLRPLIRLLFPHIPPDSPAYDAVTANMSANILGLSNAATPFGIDAIKHMRDSSPDFNKASDEMVLFTVINTVSIQLVPPMQLLTMRAQAGSQAPFEIMPALWLSSLLSALAGVGITLLYRGAERHRTKRKAECSAAAKRTKKGCTVRTGSE